MALKFNPITGTFDLDTDNVVTLDGRYVKKVGDTMAGDLDMDAYKTYYGSGGAFIGSTNDNRLLFDGGSQSYQWDNVLELFWNLANPNISLYNASDNLLSVINTGGGKGNFSAQNRLYFGYGDYLGVSPAANWSSGTHKLIAVDWDGTRDRVDVYTPGNARSTPMLSLGADATLSFFNTSLASQQTGGAATASGTYGGTEQSMLNKVYSAMRAYGLLT